MKNYHIIPCIVPVTNDLLALLLWAFLSGVCLGGGLTTGLMVLWLKKKKDRKPKLPVLHSTGC